MCAQAGHEDAMLSFRDATAEKIWKLARMEKALDEELNHACKQGLSATQLLERLLALEANALIERRIERRIKESKLPERKLLSDFDFKFQTGVNKIQVMELAHLNFVGQKQGLVIAGNSGTGKSHIAKALLLIGCQKLYRCRYTTAANMLKELLAARGDDSLDQKLKRYISPDILLIDEIGFDRIRFPLIPLLHRPSACPLINPKIFFAFVVLCVGSSTLQQTQK
jgi:DNA replication protein DnaC